MPSDAADQGRVSELLETLRQEAAALTDRIAALEGQLGAPGAGEAAHQTASLAPDGVSPEIIAAISAALAAYLGVKPHIRQISLVGGASWAQQGRVTIQASHWLNVRHD